MPPSFDQGKTWTGEGLADSTRIRELVAVPGASGDTVYALPANVAPVDAVITPPPPEPASQPAVRPPDQPANQTQTEAVFTIGSQSYSVNGQILQMDVAPSIDPISGRTLVPVRYLAEALGVAPQDITWDAKAATVTLVHRTTPVTTLVLTIGSKVMETSGPGGTEPVQMDIAPMIINGRTMLPARWVAQYLGYGVQWNASNQQVILTRTPQ